jgi:nickel-dependent lactate racemase
MRPKIAEQRERNSFQAFRPGGEGGDMVDADAQNLGIPSGEERFIRLVGWDLIRSYRRPGHWEEDQHNVFAEQTAQRNMIPQVTGQGEIWCGLADSLFHTIHPLRNSIGNPAPAGTAVRETPRADFAPEASPIAGLIILEERLYNTRKPYSLLCGGCVMATFGVVNSDPAQYLSEAQIRALVIQSLESLSLTGKRVLVIIPDSTRTMPLPLFFRIITKALLGKAQQLDFVIALGTHPPMSETAIMRMLGLTADERAVQYGKVGIFNHAWKDDGALIQLGSISSEEIEALSDGRLAVDMPVRINRHILDYDELLVCGPVYPHEVVGFSGGNKYFFPGIAGSDIIDLTHWLGALITSYETIGRKNTPMRRVIDRAASMIPVSRHALCSVVTHEDVSALFFGTPEEAFQAAADVSAQVHVRYVDAPYRQVLSILPEMYDEIWVGAKGMYKMEPVVADGGEVILYAPHITQLSAVHGTVLEEVGYHVRDYFTKQWERYRHYPWGVLAHSTHLRGIGVFEDGIERPRIQVTLATGIPREICQHVNLGYCDPEQIHPAEWSGREGEGILMVPRAGELLYRLK